MEAWLQQQACNASYPNAMAASNSTQFKESRQLAALGRLLVSCLNQSEATARALMQTFDV